METSGPGRVRAACRAAASVTHLGLAPLSYQLTRWSSSYSGPGAGAVGSWAGLWSSVSSHSGARLAQGLLGDPQEDAEHRSGPPRVTLEDVANAFGHRQHPLPHRHPREHVVDQVGRQSPPCAGHYTRNRRRGARQENATRTSCPRAGHRARPKPWANTLQARWRSSRPAEGASRRTRPRARRAPARRATRSTTALSACARLRKASKRRSRSGISGMVVPPCGQNIARRSDRGVRRAVDRG